MKKKKKKQNNLPIWRFITYICVIILILIGLTLLLSSCHEIIIDESTEISGNGSVYSGKDGNLNFIIDFNAYGEGGDISSRSAADTAPETIIVPLGDGLSLFATLEPVTGGGVRTRAAELRSLVLDTRIYIVAYKQDNVTPTLYHYEHHVGFRVDAAGAASTLVRDDLTPFSLTVGGIYKFVAYSYNDNTTFLPAISFPTTMNIEDIHPCLDLIWGASGNETITSGVNIIEIGMQHLFSKVQIDARSSVGNISVISDVQMRGYTANLDVEAGTLTAHTDSAMLFTGFGPLNTNSIASSPRIVYTAGLDATIITIGSVTVGVKTYNDLTVAFAKQLKSGYEYDLEIKFGDPEEITDDPLPAGFITYVGAFWKHNQQGERLIRMRRPPSTEADGLWSATVVRGSEWIVLDTIRSSDGNVWTSTGPSLSGNDANFESTHFLPGSAIYVNGEMNISKPEIYFRIGLKSKLNNPDDHRYGVVLLTYAGNTKRQRIFIRQGEAPDYLMGADAGSGLASRPDAVKFAPYNLTATTLNAAVDMRGAASVVNPGKLSDYPSQAGALFQWEDAVYLRYAWDAFTMPSPIAPITWPQNRSTTIFWNTLKATNETCPPGYRRPNDGSESAPVPSGNNISNSEFRQSLWLNPQNGAGVNNLDNSIWGYYADGFFDRRQTTTGNAGHANTVVSPNNAGLAYIGRLFYNPNTNASLFFPAAGRRYIADETTIPAGNLLNGGLYGYYWSSSAPGGSGWYMRTAANEAQQSNTDRSYSYSIRCVEDNSLYLTANPGNLVFAYNASLGQDVTVTTNQGTWSAVSSDPSWCTLSPSSGTTGYSFTVTCAINGGYTPRTATITVTAGGLTDYVTVTQMPMTGIFAPPGVLGVTRDGYLTLKGSVEYAGTSVAASAETFGGLSTETVYLVYFKWGSIVASSSDPYHTDFSRDALVWSPAAYNLGALKTSIGTLTGASAWALVPTHPSMSAGATFGNDITNGFGDPCRFADNGNGVAPWKTPTGNPWNGLSTLEMNHTTINAGGTSIDGRTTPDNSMFLPYAAMRYYFGLGAIGGYYWSNTYQSTDPFPGFACNLGFTTDGSVSTNASTGIDNGAPIRCIYGPIIY